MLDGPIDRLIENIKQEPQGMSVREFMDWADRFCPILSNRAYYDLSYTPPWIKEDLLRYSLYGISTIYV